jgi:peptide-methionine (S)-S-oxide reductase
VTNKAETAYLGGGCFWCVEAVFKEIKGISSVEPGYAGGSTKNPTYTEVSSGTTGHAEVAKIEFNPEMISFREILEIFFATHNPTTLNRQGSDIGTQYRSIILYQDDDQKEKAEKYIQKITKEMVFDSPIVTEVVPLDIFYQAENYHKDYYDYHKDNPYCRVIISPKIAKLRKKFSDKLK